MIRLNHWKNPSNPVYDRIYVNGLPVSGKAHLQRQKGGGVRLAIADCEEVVVEQCFQEILKAVAPGATAKDPGLWDLLTGHTAMGQQPRSRPAVAAGSASVLDRTSALDVATIKVPDPITIRVDHREPAELIAELQRAVNTTVVIEALELGDFQFGNFIVERKTVADFESSIIENDKRLFNQTERMKMEPGVVGIVLLEGSVIEGCSRMLPQQVLGALSFMVAIQGMSLIQTTSAVDTAYMLVKMATHARSGLGYELGLRASKPQQLLDSKRFVLEGCPGVNAELAKRLLAQFGTVGQVASASVAQLGTVPGIGPKKAALIYEVLNT